VPQSVRRGDGGPDWRFSPARVSSVPVPTPTHSDLVAPIYATAIVIVARDIAGNLHYVGTLWIAGVFVFSAAAAMLLRRRVLGLLAAYVALALAAASAAVGALLDPPLIDGSIRSFLIRRRSRSSLGWFAPPEEFPGRERIYVRVERAALVGNELAPSWGVVRVADFDRGALALGDEIQLTARRRYARNYWDPGEFDHGARRESMQ
jgi:hypothetical protein